MRKTRLVILPGARCLHQLGFLLLFLACPTIAFKGQENRDIQPYSRLLILKQNWIPSNTGKGIGCDGNFGNFEVDLGFSNSDNGNGNFCHNNNTRYQIKNNQDASADQQRNEIAEKQSHHQLDISWFQNDGFMVNTRRQQRQIRSLTEVKRILLDNTGRVNVDTRRESSSRSFTRSRLEKRVENGRMQLVQERRERQSFEENKRKDSARGNAFYQNRKEEIGSSPARRITERRDSRYQTTNNRFNSERNRRQDLVQRRNDRMINSVAVNSVMERRDSQNRLNDRYVRENSSRQRTVVKREVRGIPSDARDMKFERNRITTQRESRVFSRENIMERRSSNQDKSMLSRVGETNSENSFSRTMQENSRSRRTEPFLERRISVRENSFARSEVRNKENRRTLERQISSSGLTKRRIEYRTLIREKRSSDSMEREPLRQLSQRRISSRVNSLERSFNREDRSVDFSRGNHNNRNDFIRDNTFSRYETRNLEGRRTRLSRSIARDEFLDQSLLRNSEGRRSLDRELTRSLRRNSEDRRIRERYDSSARNFQRNSLDRRNVYQESPLVYSERRDLEFNTVRRNASPSRSFRVVSEERRVMERESSSTYPSRRNSELIRTLGRRESLSRESQRGTERRRISDRQSLPIYSTQRNSEYERSAVRDDSRLSGLQRIHLNRRSLETEHVRINTLERRSASRADNMVRSFERKLDERRINSRETVSRESLQRNSENRNVLARENSLIRSERTSRTSREASLPSFRINIKKSETAGIQRRENVQTNGFSSRFENERRIATETSLRDLKRNGDLVRLNQVETIRRRHLVGPQAVRREVELTVARRSFKSGERNNFAVNNYFRNVEFNRRSSEARANDNDRRVIGDKAEVLSFRIRDIKEPSSFRRIARDERLIQRSARNDRFLRKSLPAEFGSERKLSRNSNVNEDSMRHIEERSILNSYRSDLRMTKKLSVPLENIRSDRSSRITRRSSDLSDSTRFLVRSLEMRVSAERRNSRQIRQESSDVLAERRNSRQIRQESSEVRVLAERRNSRQIRQELSEVRVLAERRNSRQIRQESLEVRVSAERRNSRQIRQESSEVRVLAERRNSRQIRQESLEVRVSAERRNSRQIRQESSEVRVLAERRNSRQIRQESLEVRVSAERRNSRQIKQELSEARIYVPFTENSSIRSSLRQNNNKFQKIMNFQETNNEEFISKKSTEQFTIYSWFKQLLESFKQAGRDLYDGIGKLNLLESMNANENIQENHQDNYNGLWNNKKHAESSYFSGAITGGILCASLYFNVQKREVY